MDIYLQFLKTILDKGVHKNDRTGTGTTSYFGLDMRFDLQEGFPLVTTKRCHFPSIVHELLWFLAGETNAKILQEKGVRIWNEWADDDGELGPIYGKQWRAWKGADGRVHDQISTLLDTLKNNPDSRRMIVNAWNVGQLDEMALPPCHAFFQFYVAQGRLSCKLTQRSADAFLGVPFNIASYALLTHMIAAQVGLEVGTFIWSGGDCHIYDNHREQVATQLEREPYALPSLSLRPVDSLFDYTYEDIELIDYKHHEKIIGKVAV